MSENANFITTSLSTPIAVNLEITSGCNHKCRYCYNYWRDESGHDHQAGQMTLDQLDVIIKRIIDANVLNVIFSGGEPFLNYEVLKCGVEALNKAGIKTTCNSNLTLATHAQLEELKRAGLPHILTSISSHHPDVNDMIFGRQGSFHDVISNVKYAVRLGIKVSINNVLNAYNYQDVFETGMLVHSLGASNYFVTRAGVNKKQNPAAGEIVILQPSQYLQALDQAIEVKKRTDINIYSLYQYPLCLLKDAAKYGDFFGRGCPAGKKLININVDGEMHACNHETESYGNVFDVDIKTAWDNMGKWRDGSLIPEDCKSCKWLSLCEAGCRMAADALDDYDYLYQGSQAISDSPDPEPFYQQSLQRIRPGIMFMVNPDIRFRRENGSCLIHTVGGWMISVKPDVSDYLRQSIASELAFAHSEFPGDNILLACLLAKKIVFEKRYGDASQYA